MSDGETSAVRWREAALPSEATRERCVCVCVCVCVVGVKFFVSVVHVCVCMVRHPAI